MARVRIVGCNVNHGGPIEEFAVVEIESDRSEWVDDISFRRIIEGQVTRTGTGWGRFRGEVENIGGIVSFAGLKEDDPDDDDVYLQLTMKLTGDKITLVGVGTVQSHKPKLRHWPDEPSPFAR